MRASSCVAFQRLDFHQLASQLVELGAVLADDRAGQLVGACR